MYLEGTVIEQSPLPHPLIHRVDMTTSIGIPDDDVSGSYTWSYISQEYKCMLSRECSHFFSSKSLPGHLPFSTRPFALILSCYRKE